MVMELGRDVKGPGGEISLGLEEGSHGSLLFLLRWVDWGEEAAVDVKLFVGTAQ